jgi:hypothetical protein
LANWTEAAKRVAVIVYFLVGLAAGAAFATIAYHRRSRNGFLWALGTEAAMLFALLTASEILGRAALLTAAPTGPYFALLALPTLAMGPRCWRRCGPPTQARCCLGLATGRPKTR